MNGPESQLPSPAMQQRPAAAQKVISKAIALEIAGSIVLEELGQAGLNAQIPFSISAEGDYWRVRGADNDGSEVNEFGKRVPFGSLDMIISQYDGQIADLKYGVRISQWPSGR